MEPRSETLPRRWPLPGPPAQGGAAAPGATALDATALDATALGATIELAPIGIAHFDRAGRLRLVNERLCAILGYPREALLALSFHELTLPEDRPHSRAQAARLTDGPVPSYCHAQRFVRRDGSVVCARVTVSAVRGRHGDGDLLVAMLEDVSERQASDEARCRAEERLRIALAASHTGTFRWDVRSGALECDEHLERLFGFEPGSTRTGASFRARIHPDDVQRLQDAWQRCASDGVELEEEFRVVWPDGSVRWLRDRGRRITQADGSPLHVAGACTDVTEHRRMEDELRAQEERFRTLANAIPQLAWTTDASGAVTWYNQRWYDYTGTMPEEVQGWGWQKLLRPDLVERVVAPVRHSLATGEPWEDTFPLRRRDGEYRWFLSRALPFRDRHGAVVGWFGTNTDITDRLEADMERERLLVAERGARAEAERASRMRDELLGIVAHDLRNPVHTIVMTAATMREIPLCDDQRARHLAIIERTAKGMNRLIADLLDVTRIESGSLAIHRAPVDVGALIDDMLELFAPQAQARRIALAGDVAPALPPVPGDRERLVQVLSNLLGNALKFTPPGGCVRLRASGLEAGVRISVADSGCGIAADGLPHVFDRFWQADRTSRAGAGLGLAIARGIVGAHGGTIAVESAVGVGSTFHVTLPRGDGGDPAAAR